MVERGVRRAAVAVCMCAALGVLGVSGAARQAGSMWWRLARVGRVMTSGYRYELPRAQRGGAAARRCGGAGDLGVGANGVVLKSTDGGKNWERIAVPGGDELDFCGVRAFSSAAAYVMSSGSGEKSKIFKTIDGGATWKMQFTDTRPAFFLMRSRATARCGAWR